MVSSPVSSDYIITAGLISVAVFQETWACSLWPISFDFLRALIYWPTRRRAPGLPDGWWWVVPIKVRWFGPEKFYFGNSWRSFTWLHHKAVNCRSNVLWFDCISIIFCTSLSTQMVPTTVWFRNIQVRPAMKAISSHERWNSLTVLISLFLKYVP